MSVIQTLWMLLATVLMAIVVTLLWNYVFGSNYSLWFGVALAICSEVTHPLWLAAEKRLGLKWFPDLSEYKQRLADLKAERERLASKEMK